jgi:carboxylesterase
MDLSETNIACRHSIQTAQEEGVTDPNNLPFMLSPANATKAVLLVHGFTATPSEMRPVAERLLQAGLASYGVRLPGHGTTPQDLSHRQWQEWYVTVEQGYKSLKEDFPIVYGAGMSTGCLLLSVLAAQNPLDGMVLFSPYLQISHWLAPYAGWLKWFMPYQTRPEHEQSNRYYHRRPVAGVHQINCLIRTLRPLLPQISCPVMAFNGEGDQTVDIASGQQFVENLGSIVKVHQKFGPEVGHVLTLEENPCRQVMFEQMLNFIQRIEPPSLAE